jgi:2-keto-myo-inositol isomerase
MMPSVQNAFALHTWSLDTTPLQEVLQIARRTGWDGVELRRLDFERAEAQGQSEADVVDLVRRGGLAVSAVGVTLGWMFTDGPERAQLLSNFERSCAAAAALDCSIAMSPVDRGTGEVGRAAASIREVGDIAARYNVKLALEFNSQAEQFNTLESVREVLARAGHPACGLLLDTYHLQRSGRFGRSFDDLQPEEIVYVQYSDVPRDGLRAGYATDRLPPGAGVIDFDEVCALISDKAYTGPLSYEGPNPAAWARDPGQVAQEALQASRTAFARVRAGAALGES